MGLPFKEKETKEEEAKTIELTFFRREALRQVAALVVPLEELPRQLMRESTRHSRYNVTPHARRVVFG